jgi:hypothetical protein
MIAVASILRSMLLRGQLCFQQVTAWPFMAAALVGLVALFYAGVLIPQQNDVAALRERLVTANARMQAAPKARVEASVDSAQLDASAMLQGTQDLSGMIDRLFVSAKRHGLQLRSGEYKASHVRSVSVQSVQVTLPLTGDYRRIKAWLIELLETLPNASVDRLTLRRENASASQLDVDVVLTLWHRESAPGPAASSYALSP